MEGVPGLVGKIKTYYAEIVCGMFFACALGYFCYSTTGNRQNGEFLNKAKSKLLLMEARHNRMIERKLNEEEDKSCKECFEAALADAGFKILKIEHKLNHISAIVVNNAGARARFMEILDGVRYVESDGSLEVRWFFNAKKEIAVAGNSVAGSKENTQHNVHISGYTLSAICLFDDSSWQVWLNGKMYDQANRQLPNGGVIEKVTAGCVMIKQGSENMRLELN